jgi:hypothetical protein
MAEDTSRKPAAKPELTEAEKPADAITGGSVSQAKATEKPKPEAKAPYVRTAIKTRNPEKGRYDTLNRQFSIRASEKAGHWDLYHLDERVEATIKGWDASLNRIVELGLAKVSDLNTEPPKPAAPAKAKAADPTPEKDESDRRSGATGPAPRKTRGPGEAIHTRKSRAAKVG